MSNTFSYKTPIYYGGIGYYTSANSSAGTYSVVDDQDFSNDGYTWWLDNLSINGSTYTLVYTTANGIIVWNSSYDYYLFSNTSYSSGYSLSTTGMSFSYCFLAGTSILTPNGNQPIESLKRGDLVITHQGDALPIRWVGQQTIENNLGYNDTAPVKISAHALGENLPEQDLYLTGSHALFIDGQLINASVLVNGKTITRVPMSDMPESFTYYHIETDAHEAIIANGLAAETFVDAPDRRSFDNYNEYVDYYGAERIIPEMDVPRVTSTRQLPLGIREQLKLDSIESDWEALVTDSDKLTLKQAV